jgi:2-hydroxy-3-keto-5-methylthiopentenyl-1-phosphate phosphatase
VGRDARLIVVDFDGTITQDDMLVDMCRRHAPEVFAEVEAGLRAGRITLRECIRREFEAITGNHDEIVADAVQRAQVRAGFAEFVRAAEAAGDRVVVVSAGFRSVIQPVLEREGVGHLELIANEVRFGPERTEVRFLHGDGPCDVCGEECKRTVVRELRDGFGTVVYIGDGYSDRCAAMDADVRFARRSLAKFLKGRKVAYKPFEDFGRVCNLMGLRSRPA